MRRVDGRWKHPLYNIWNSMRDRCNNPNSKDFESYGKRGIKVDPAWDDFWQFARDMEPRPKGMTLDRVDNDGPYSKANCRWATRSQQQRNKRDPKPSNNGLVNRRRIARREAWNETV